MIYIVGFSSCLDIDITLSEQNLSTSSLFPNIYTDKIVCLGGKVINVSNVLYNLYGEFKTLIFDNYKLSYKEKLIDKYSKQKVEETFKCVKIDDITDIRCNYKIRNCDRKFLFEINQKPFTIDFSIVKKSIDELNIKKGDILVLTGSCEKPDLIYKTCKYVKNKCDVIVDTNYCLKDIIEDTTPFLVKVNMDEILKAYDLLKENKNEQELLNILNNIFDKKVLKRTNFFITNGAEACFYSLTTSNSFKKIDVEQIEKLKCEYGNGDAILAMILKNITKDCAELENVDLEQCFKDSLKMFKVWNDKRIL